jgi:subtilisin family serine protease
MKKPPLLTCLGLFTACASAVAPAAHASAPVAGDYIVVVNRAVDPGAVAADHGRRFGFRTDFVYRNALRGYAAHIPPGQVSAVRSDPRVASLAPVFPLDPIEGAGSGNATKTHQILPTNINRIDADVSSTRSGDGTGVVAGPAVATMDTGIDASQPDLNVRGGVNCSPDGRPSTAYGDDGGHGTHTAGTIGARDDAGGVVGVAPGVPLYAVRVVQTGAGTANTTANALCGIDWLKAHAAEYGIKVANASLGYTQQFGWSGADTGSCGKDTSGTVVDALHAGFCDLVASGVTVVASMGNSTIDARGTAPAAFDEVLSVSAMADFDGRPGGLARPTCSTTYGADDTVATFSNFTTIGNVAPDADWTHTISAPGVCVTSDALRGGTAVMSGTSMSAPAVSGTVALCLASGACAGLTPAGIIAKLRGDAFAHRSAAPGYGFTGDPTGPAADGTPSDATGSRYYGPLVYAGGY